MKLTYSKKLKNHKICNYISNSWLWQERHYDILWLFACCFFLRTVKGDTHKTRTKIHPSDKLTSVRKHILATLQNSGKKLENLADSKFTHDKYLGQMENKNGVTYHKLLSLKKIEKSFTSSICEAEINCRAISILMKY